LVILENLEKKRRTRTMNKMVLFGWCCMCGDEILVDLDKQSYLEWRELYICNDGVKRCLECQERIKHEVYNIDIHCPECHQYLYGSGAREGYDSVQEFKHCRKAWKITYHIEIISEKEKEEQDQ